MTSTLHIVVAMKPLDGNFASNAIKHGVAGLNIDACRISVADADRAFYDAGMARHERYAEGKDMVNCHEGGWKVNPGAIQNKGARFPANVILEDSEKIVRAFPIVSHKTGGVAKTSIGNGKTYHGGSSRIPIGFNDSGSAARFFKQVKED